MKRMKIGAVGIFWIAVLGIGIVAPKVAAGVIAFTFILWVLDGLHIIDVRTRWDKE